MPTQPPYVNHAYWKQLTLLDGGFLDIYQRFTVAMDATSSFMTCSVELARGDTDEWVELEGPIWRGPLHKHPILADVMHTHVLLAQDYLAPF